MADIVPNSEAEEIADEIRSIPETPAIETMKAPEPPPVPPTPPMPPAPAQPLSEGDERTWAMLADNVRYACPQQLWMSVFK